ncbi:MAG: CPBP family glutamic-type intramembrane protease [Nanoarchaeota archaeon]
MASYEWVDKGGVPKTFSVVLLCLSAIVLVGLQQKAPGWILWALGTLTLFFAERRFAKHLVLVSLGLAILGLTPITTDLSSSHFVVMGLTLIAALSVPYLVSRFVYKEDLIKVSLYRKRGWNRGELAYFGVATAIFYFLIPFYLQSTGAYLNWSKPVTSNDILRLFMGTNALGLWDELFFICTAFLVLRKVMPFIWANLVQSIMFTSFLYELGFTGWGPLFLFPFAFFQGFMFKKTESLGYVIALHLTLDFLLFLALVHAHNPSMASVFVF